MLFITDQHHLNGLELIVRKYGRNKTLRLLGDISPNQEHVGGGKEIEEGSSLLKRCQIAFKEQEGISRYQEITFAQKMQAHEGEIQEADEELFNEFVAYYGAGPIFNLVRKHYTNHFVRSKVICLHGNEKLLDHAQRIVHARFAEEWGLHNHAVMKYLIDFLRERKQEVYDMLAGHLDECGIGNAREFMLRSLQVSNYRRQVPTSLTVFRDYPKRKKFDFKDSICWEKRDDSILIYVPYFNDEIERNGAIAQIRDLERFISRAEARHVLIGYHGNPFPNLMEDKRLHVRVDHNLVVIQAVIDAIVRVKGDQQEVKILCGHLHASNPEYYWPGRENILVQPMSTREVFHFNTRAGTLTKEEIKY